MVNVFVGKLDARNQRFWQNAFIFSGPCLNPLRDKPNATTILAGRNHTPKAPREANQPSPVSGGGAMNHWETR
jgi:hypothetical protein